MFLPLPRSPRKMPPAQNQPALQARAQQKIFQAEDPNKEWDFLLLNADDVPDGRSGFLWKPFLPLTGGPVPSPLQTGFPLPDLLDEITAFSVFLKIIHNGDPGMADGFQDQAFLPKSARLFRSFPGNYFDGPFFLQAQMHHQYTVAVPPFPSTRFQPVFSKQNRISQYSYSPLSEESFPVSIVRPLSDFGK